jgi:hypothetical protein
MDTDCVVYHLDNPDEISKLICTGIPSNTSLSIILEEFDKRLCGISSSFGVIGQDTNTIDITVTSLGNVYTIKNDLKFIDSNTIDFSSSSSGFTGSVRIDPASTIPYSIGPNGIKLDCCTNICSNTIQSINTSLASVQKQNNFFSTLIPTYFTKSDYILSITLNSIINITNGVFSYKKCTLIPFDTTVSYSQNGQIILNINSCAKDIINKQFYLLTESYTTNNCYEFIKCSVTTNKVNYSERFNWAYRFNPQMNNYPIFLDSNVYPGIDKGILYFNDVKAVNLGTSNGSVIRKINLNTNEVTTIAGIITTGAGAVTLNNVAGDVVAYDYLSGPSIDKNDISNGEPVIYCAAFGNGGSIGSTINKLIKEVTGNCDERKNWKNYVLAGNATQPVGDNPATVGTTVSGSAARFAQCYGIKKWFTINGQPSFFIVDKANGKLKYLYYSGTGNVNSSVNWRVTYFGFNLLAGVSANINIDDDISGDKLLFSFGIGRIQCYKFSITTPSLSDVTNLANYVLQWQTGGVISENNVGPLPLIGVTDVYYISKYVDYTSSSTYYLFGNNDGVPSTNSAYSILRKFEPLGTNFYNVVNPSTTQLGTVSSTNVLNTINGYSNGFFQDLQNTTYDLTVGGIRKWDFVTNPLAVTNSLEYGGSSSTSTATTWSGIQQTYMDTQYDFNITC